MEQAWLLAGSSLFGPQGSCGAHGGSSVLETHTCLTAPSAESKTEPGDQSWALLCHRLVMTLAMQFDLGDAV